MLQSLEIPPGAGDPFFWADFAELRALIHPDRCYSRGDLSSLSKRIRDTSRTRNFNDESRWRDLISFMPECARTSLAKPTPFASLMMMTPLELSV